MGKHQERSPDVTARSKADSASPPRPWDQLPDESPKAFEAFDVFRSLGPNRSVAKVEQQIGKGYRILRKWSAQHHWIVRSRAWDQYQAELVHEHEIEAVAEMRRRQIVMAGDFFNAANLELQKVIRAARQNEGLVLPPEQVRLWADFAVKLERLNRGEPTDLVETKNTDTIDLSKCSDEDLDALERVVTSGKGAK